MAIQFQVISTEMNITFLYVVDIGHMLGLEQEREESGESHVMYLFYDPPFNYVCLFVCMNYYRIVIILAHNY